MQLFTCDWTIFIWMFRCVFIARQTRLNHFHLIDAVILKTFGWFYRLVFACMKKLNQFKFQKKNIIQNFNEKSNFFLHSFELKINKLTWKWCNDLMHGKLDILCQLGEVLVFGCNDLRPNDWQWFCTNFFVNYIELKWQKKCNFEFCIFNKKAQIHQPKPLTFSSEIHLSAKSFSIV